MKAMIGVKHHAGTKVVNAETVRLEAGRQRQHAAGGELLRTQGWLEYGVLLTAVGGLAVRFANEGFQFIEDYAIRLRRVQAVFSTPDRNNDHIRVLFVAVTGADLPAELSTPIELVLQTSAGNLGWRVTGLHVEHPLETSMEAAREILVKLTEVSDRFDSLSNERPTEGNLQVRAELPDVRRLERIRSWSVDMRSVGSGRATANQPEDRRSFSLLSVPQPEEASGRALNMRSDWEWLSCKFGGNRAYFKCPGRGSDG